MYNPTESHYTSRNQDPPVPHPYVWMKGRTLSALGPEKRVYQVASIKESSKLPGTKHNRIIQTVVWVSADYELGCGELYMQGRFK